ncbi:hypothetical protein HC776_01020, partial [bacterium]|nr:hypothetical protein [bacterium]
QTQVELLRRLAQNQGEAESPLRLQDSHTPPVVTAAVVDGAARRNHS